jgi:hypothetical protein
MTIKDLFDTLDFSSYYRILLHWPILDDPEEFHKVEFEYSEPLVELFGDVHIMTMDESHEYDGGDASFFITLDSENRILIHIYLRREDVFHDDN